MDCLKKSNWSYIKDKVQKVNPSFYRLLEEVKPPKELSVYIAKYKYGQLLGSKKDAYLPSSDGGMLKLGDKTTPSEIMKDLGYGKDSIPLGVVISNYLECYSEEKDTKEVYPFALQGPGTITNKRIAFEEAEGIENSTISASAGSKSAFMLPYIGSRIPHERIRETFGITSPPPKSPQEHHKIFKGILKQNDWHVEIIFFSQQWVKEIRNNPKWVFIKLFLSEQMCHGENANIYNSFYNNLFMTAKKINKFRPTPFLVDTAKVIFNIAMNKGCGIYPATDESKLPLRDIQKAYQEIYELKYTPTIMVPGNLSQANNSVYYSLQQPSTKINTFKIKLNNSTIRELDALKDILTAYLQEFSDSKGVCYESSLYYACETLSLEFFHNMPNTKGIKPSSKIIELDDRFKFSHSKAMDFSADAKFFRGCIKISSRDKVS